MAHEQNAVLNTISICYQDLYALFNYLDVIAARNHKACAALPQLICQPNMHVIICTYQSNLHYI